MSSSGDHQFVNIHPHGTEPAREGRPQIPKAHKQPSAGPVKFRAGASGRGSGDGFNRQVSLESGVAILGGGSLGSMGDTNRSADVNSGTNKSADIPPPAPVGPRRGKSLGPGVRAENATGRRGDFSMFRTRSTLSKQSTMLPMRKESDPDLQNMVGGDYDGGGATQDNPVNHSVPAGRYFAALRGPELDQVRDYEDILLPKDELWPFLLRFPINTFGICLGLGSQAILWGSLSRSPATAFLHVSPVVNEVLWALALVALVAVAATYACKCAFYFEAVRREYFHPIRVNFFFAPWIVCMFLGISLPQSISKHPNPACFACPMLPVLALELKIYGQWLSGGKRRLCRVANPSTHLSVVGNFVGAILASRVGWLEPAKFLWAIGFAHYLVVFVTLYQRLPTNEALPKELHPVYCMFIAAPSAASIAWAGIYGEFDEVARTCFFIALFLYTSLVVRLNFFRGFQFSVAWWSYTFPMTTASVATIRYAEQVPCLITKALAVALSLVSSTIVSLLLVSTLLHGVVWRSLFPNDLAIAITKSKAPGGGGGGKSKRVDQHGNVRSPRGAAGRGKGHDILKLVASVSPLGGKNGGVNTNGKVEDTNGELAMTTFNISSANGR